MGANLRPYKTTPSQYLSMCHPSKFDPMQAAHWIFLFMRIFFSTIFALVKAANTVDLSSVCEGINPTFSEWPVLVHLSNSFEDWGSVYKFLLLHSEEAFRVAE